MNEILFCRILWISNGSKKFSRHFSFWNSCNCRLEDHTITLFSRNNQSKKRIEIFDIRYAKVQENVYSNEENCLIINCLSIRRNIEAEIILKYDNKIKVDIWRKAIEAQIDKAFQEQMKMATLSMNIFQDFFDDTNNQQIIQSQNNESKSLIKKVSTNDDDFEIINNDDSITDEPPIIPSSTFSFKYFPPVFPLPDLSKLLEHASLNSNSSSTEISQDITSSDILTYTEQRDSYFTGHSKVLFVSGLESSTKEDQQLTLDIKPWQWLCPIPRLRILIMVVGTRGDVQPFAILGMKLLADGHRVRLATHETYRDYVSLFGGGGLEFFPLAGDPVKLSEFMVKSQGNILPTNTEVLKQVPENLSMLNDILKSCWPACVGTDPKVQNQKQFKADVIISNPVTYGHIHCAEALGVPLHLMFPQPWTPTKAFPHPLSCFNYHNVKWSTENYLSYQLVDRMLWLPLEPFINSFRKNTLKLLPIRTGEHGWNLLNKYKVPFVKMWSKHLVPKPKDWGSHIDVVGFFFENNKNNNEEKEEGIEKNIDNNERTNIDPLLSISLRNYLSHGPKPIFVGFGSMIIENIENIIEIFLEAAALIGVRIIFQYGWTQMKFENFQKISEKISNKLNNRDFEEIKKQRKDFEYEILTQITNDQDMNSSTGFLMLEEVFENNKIYLNRQWSPDDALLIDPCSHDLLFPHIAAVVHHGGAGTTAAGLRAGKPTFICPFFGDQPFWGEMVYRAKVGPEPCPIHQITISSVAKSIVFLVHPQTILIANSLSKKIKSEDGVGNARSSFYKHLHIENMICDISIFIGESQLAHVWCEKCGFKMTREVSDCIHDPLSLIFSEKELIQHKITPCTYINWSRHRTPSNATEGIIQGIGGATHEIMSGITETLLEPINSIVKGDNISHVVDGFITGIKGLIISPLSGGTILLDKVRTGFNKSLQFENDPNFYYTRDGSMNHLPGSIYGKQAFLKEFHDLPDNEINKREFDINLNDDNDEYSDDDNNDSEIEENNNINNENEDNENEKMEEDDDNNNEDDEEINISENQDELPGSSSNEGEDLTVCYQAAHLEESNQSDQESSSNNDNDNYNSDIDYNNNSNNNNNNNNNNNESNDETKFFEQKSEQLQEEKEQNIHKINDDNNNDTHNNNNNNNNNNYNNMNVKIESTPQRIIDSSKNNNDESPPSSSEKIIGSPYGNCDYVNVTVGDQNENKLDQIQRLKISEARKLEIIGGYHKAYQIKSSLIEVLGTNSRFVTLKDFTEIFMKNFKNEDENKIEDLIQLIFKNLSGTRKFLDFIDISLLFLSMKGNDHWKKLPLNQVS